MIPTDCSALCAPTILLKILVMIMYKMEQFIQSAILLLILTAISVFSSFSPYVCILLAGILMTVFTIRSLSDRQNWLLSCIQLLLSAAFAAVSANPFACLIGYECRSIKHRWVPLLIPSLFYGTLQLFTDNIMLPQIICNILLLLVISAIIYIAEQLVTRYIFAHNQIAQAVSITAVNEMYEKKLNQELLIKNHLTEKNARLEERENISRNIHNSVGHSITAAIMTLDAADMLFDSAPDKAREKMNTANERIRTSLDTIRQAVRVLDSENPLVDINDFIRQLTSVTDSFMMDTTLQIRTDFTSIQPDLQLPHEHTEFLTGALQELLSNGVRHGNATLFTIRLVTDSGHVRLYVSDNGNSDFSPNNMNERIQNGYGLKKLISYARRHGGSAAFSNENGFKSDITLPLLKEDEYE